MQALILFLLPPFIPPLSKTDGKGCILRLRLQQVSKMVTRSTGPLACTIMKFDRRTGMWHYAVKISVQVGMVAATGTTMSLCSECGGDIQQWHHPLECYYASPSLRMGVGAVMGAVAMLRAVRMVVHNSTSYDIDPTSCMQLNPLRMS